MLAVSLETFERYQREQAWTWEHMALLRARPVYGPQDTADRIERAYHGLEDGGMNKEFVFHGLTDQQPVTVGPFIARGRSPQSTGLGSVG